MNFSGPVIERAVQHTRELERILRLPRRVWDPKDLAKFATELSSLLKTPHGKMELRPIQAAALYEAGTLGGLFGPISVGAGKTLISLLIPYVLKSKRPLLLTRANLIEKTKRERMELAYHWPIPNFIRLMSYESLGRANHSKDLDIYQPDLIICDEAQRIKNPKAAVTKRVTRYMTEYPDTKFVAISGTIIDRSLKNCAHTLRWSLKPLNAPVPQGWSEVVDWGDAIDEKPNQHGERTMKVGALLALCTPEERLSVDPISAVRRAYRRRLVETPGVVATSEGELGTSLTIQAHEIDMSPTTDSAFQQLRDRWETPDNWPIAEPMSLWRHARELAMGFFYKWEPRPQREWLDARKEWAAICREILSTNRSNLDSELQVINAVDQGAYPYAVTALAVWRKIKPIFIPNTTPVWLDDSVLEAASRWAMQGHGIIWVEHVAVAEMLARKTNLAYYGQRGQDNKGRPIELHNPKESLIASLGSNSEGRNLQAWHRNLILSPPSNGKAWEQLLGRTHRPGQRADEVTVDFFITALEHIQAFEQAREDARYQEDITGQPQKLNFADIVFPLFTYKTGHRWIK